MNKIFNVNYKGFTLIELLIVAVIIGILATLSFPVYQGYIWKAKLSEVFTITSMVEKAYEAYRAEVGEDTGGRMPIPPIWDSGHGHDPSGSNSQKLLNIEIPSTCIFEYYIEINNGGYTIVRFKYPTDSSEAWSYYINVVSAPKLNRKWVKGSISPETPSKKYFTPPAGTLYP